MPLLLNKMNSHLLRAFSPFSSVPISKPPSVRSRRADTKSTRKCSTASFTPHGGDTGVPDHAPVHRSGQRLQLSQTVPSQQPQEGSTSHLQESKSLTSTPDTQELPGRWWNTLKTQEKKPVKAKLPLWELLHAQVWCSDPPPAGLYPRWHRGGQGHLSGMGRGISPRVLALQAAPGRCGRTRAVLEVLMSGNAGPGWSCRQGPRQQRRGKSRLIEAAPSGRPGFQRPGHAVMSASTALRREHN